jgi:hypothetical protein
MKTILLIPAFVFRNEPGFDVIPLEPDLTHVHRGG